jgi:hypothetical protein
VTLPFLLLAGGDGHVAHHLGQLAKLAVKVDGELTLFEHVDEVARVVGGADDPPAVGRTPLDNRGAAALFAVTGALITTRHWPSFQAIRLIRASSTEL